MIAPLGVKEDVPFVRSVEEIGVVFIRYVPRLVANTVKGHLHKRDSRHDRLNTADNDGGACSDTKPHLPEEDAVFFDTEIVYSRAIQHVVLIHAARS